MPGPGLPFIGELVEAERGCGGQGDGGVDLGLDDPRVRAGTLALAGFGFGFGQQFFCSDVVKEPVHPPLELSEYPVVQ